MTAKGISVELHSDLVRLPDMYGQEGASAARAFLQGVVGPWN